MLSCLASTAALAQAEFPTAATGGSRTCRIERRVKLPVPTLDGRHGRVAMTKAGGLWVVGTAEGFRLQPLDARGVPKGPSVDDVATPFQPHTFEPVGTAFLLTGEGTCEGGLHHCFYARAFDANGTALSGSFSAPLSSGRREETLCRGSSSPLTRLYGSLRDATELTLQRIELSLEEGTLRGVSTEIERPVLPSERGRPCFLPGRNGGELLSYAYLSLDGGPAISFYRLNSDGGADAGTTGRVTELMRRPGDGPWLIRRVGATAELLFAKGRGFEEVAVPLDGGSSERREVQPAPGRPGSRWLLPLSASMTSRGGVDLARSTWDGDELPRLQLSRTLAPSFGNLTFANGRFFAIYGERDEKRGTSSRFLAVIDCAR